MITVDATSKSDLFEFLQYKQLLYYLIWRDFKVRYKQAFLGIFWTILQPLVFALIISTIIVQRLNFDFGFEGVSNVALVVLSFSIWTFFESGFSAASGSLLSNQGLMKKVYIPKITLILSSVLIKIVDFLLSFVVFLVFLFATGSAFHWVGFVVLVPVIFMLGLTNFFIGLFLAPLNIRFRDIRFIIPFITRIMFFSTPIWYPFSSIPEKWQPVFLLNPVVAGIEITRNAFFGGLSYITWEQIVLPLITIFVLMILGVWVFRRQENKIADYI